MNVIALVKYIPNPTGTPSIRIFATSGCTVTVKLHDAALVHESVA